MVGQIGEPDKMTIKKFDQFPLSTTSDRSGFEYHKQEISFAKKTHGPWTGLVYGGGSVAVDRKEKILGLCKDRDRDILLITLDL